MKATLKVTPNYSKRTFTIRVVDGDYKAKYRTLQMNQEDFDCEEMNTEKDWKYFLKSDNYYKI